MRKTRHSTGEIIVLREIWNGKIWTARPMIVVQDTPELLALHIPPRTKWKQCRSLEGKRVTAKERKTNTWKLYDAMWDGLVGYLKLAIPGETYSVIVFWDDTYERLRYWYINLENPVYRTAKGFEYMDQILDVIVMPNLKDWHWKDEDELQEAMALGLISLEQSKALYVKGEQVRDLIMSGKSIFNKWEKWRPNPNWETPVLPEGWDVI